MDGWTDGWMDGWSAKRNFDCISSQDIILSRWKSSLRRNNLNHIPVLYYTTETQHWKENLFIPRLPCKNPRVMIIPYLCQKYSTTKVKPTNLNDVAITNLDNHYLHAAETQLKLSFYPFNSWMITWIPLHCHCFRAPHSMQNAIMFYRSPTQANIYEVKEIWLTIFIQLTKITDMVKYLICNNISIIKQMPHFFLCMYQVNRNHWPWHWKCISYSCDR